MQREEEEVETRGRVEIRESRESRESRRSSLAMPMANATGPRVLQPVRTVFQDIADYPATKCKSDDTTIDMDRG